MAQVQTASDRRKFHRILFDATVSVQAGGQYFETKLIDISLNGALCRRPWDWKRSYQGLAVLEIRLDEDGSTIRMDAEISHTEKDAVGFHCRYIDIDSITHLRRLVEFNSQNPAQLERELAALG